MLKSEKYVSKIRKVMIGIIAIIVLLGIYININSLPVLGATELGQGTINPIYKPEWEKVSSSLDTGSQTMSIIVKGTASESQTINSDVGINYSSDVTGYLEPGDITVYVDGSEASSITKTVTKLTPADSSTGAEVQYEIKLSGFDQGSRLTGKPYKDWSGNVKIKIAGRGEDSETYDENVLLDKYGNQSMMEEDYTTGTWIDVTFQDPDSTTNVNTSGTMFADFIKPEFTYVYSDTTTIIENGETAESEVVTIIFDVVDKYFASTTLSSLDASQITVQVDSYDVTELNNAITKTLTKVTDITDTVNGVADTKIGERYQLVIKGLDEEDGFKYSGYMTLAFGAGTITDKSSNTSDATSITVGKDEPDGSGDGTIVDVVDPVWKAENIDINFDDDEVSVDLSATDKYYAGNTISTDQILVYIDGALDGDANGNGVLDTGETPVLVKTLSTGTNLTPAGTGIKYTLTLSNWNADEYSGTTKIVIPKNTITDQHGNASNEQEFLIGHIDFIKPVIEKVSSTKDSAAKTETIVFTATDKYMDTSDLVEEDEITVYVDGELATGVTIQSLTEEPITETRNGSTVTIGHTYTLVLTNFEQSTLTRQFTDWSGTVEIKVAEGAVKDIQVENPNGEIAGGNLNDETTIKGDFVDFIRPKVSYEYFGTSRDTVPSANPDIDYTNKEFKMEINVIDKYHTEGSKLGLEDFTIQMTNGQLNGSGEVIVYNLQELDGVTVSLNSDTAITANISKTTNQATGTYSTVNDAIIGYKYIITVTGLEQLARAVGANTADYSGIVTVAVTENEVTDTSSNGNEGASLTAGVDFPGATGSGTVVDVVDPIWEKVSSSAYAIDPADPTTSTATIKIIGTDTYFNADDIDASTLTSDEIEIYINGTKNTSIIPVISEATPKSESRMENGTTSTVQYGVEYTITLTGWVQNANQVKIRILKDAITDQSGNGNKETDLILYNVLKTTVSEQEATSAFLGESVATTIYPEGVTEITPIARQDIHQVEFVSTTAGSKAEGVQRVWDVSAQGDKSILAWTSQTSAPYTVYIGSDWEIFGNQMSAYLFSYIGYSTSSTATDTILYLDKLNTTGVTNMAFMFHYMGHEKMSTFDLGDKFYTSNVTNMQSMFAYTGYKLMTALDLGDNFNTSKVTNMDSMFLACGFTKMNTFSLGGQFDTGNVKYMSLMFARIGFRLPKLDLGENFDTKNVEDMNHMFYRAGYFSMTELDLGDSFDTSNVTNMDGMFLECGYTKLQSLDLGDEFDTSKVTDMSYMFNSCGYKKMISLDLGPKFNTKNVTEMEGMFQECGYTLMTSLDLGDQFYTTSATTMTEMFNGCGNSVMTALDLGPAFTQIASTNTDMFTDAGKAGECVIYAPEAIYSSKTAFKLNSTDTTNTISYANGTINPIYRPEWTHTSTIDTTNKTLTVTLKGSAYKTQTIDSNVKINYASDVAGTLEAGDIKVFIDGVEVTNVVYPTRVLSVGTTSTNTTSGKTEVTHTFTLSNLEEAVRQATLPYKEWSGNITLKIGGRGQATSTYTANVLTDKYGSSVDGDGNVTIGLTGNQNMMEEDYTTGTWIDIKLADATVNANTNGTMFADFIKPEFTYDSSTTLIGSGAEGDKKVVVVFDVIDKYFNNTDLATNAETIASQTIVKMSDYTDEEVNAAIEKVIEKVEDIEYPTGTKIGERYKLTISKLEQTDENGFGDGFKFSGYMSIAFPADIVTDNSGNKNVGTTITIGIDEPNDSGAATPVLKTDYSTPYLPSGYSYVEGDFSTGITIQDGLGNQYVWVEVPRNTTVYDEIGVNLDLDSLSGDALTTAYSDIETELQEYAEDYRDPENFTDTWSSEEATGIASADDYNDLKNTMLKSVYENGGFYIGKYETGTATARTAETDALTTAVVQQNMYPYNYVTNAQAQSLASGMSSGEYTSSLLFGIQWDLVMKYLETKGATQEELSGSTTGSTNWGNYSNSTYNITNESAKYAVSANSWAWNDGAYGEKASGTQVLLSTGADSQFSKMGIYDLAGNVSEWTLEQFTFNSDAPCTIAGGAYVPDGNTFPASLSGGTYTTSSAGYFGFRVALYKEGQATEDELIDLATGTIVDVVDPTWTLSEASVESGLIKLRVKDKYLDIDSCAIDEDMITVYTNGVPSTTIVKTLNGPTVIEEGVEYEYTLQLSNVTLDNAPYQEFTPTNLSELYQPATYQYRSENGGHIELEIAKGAAIDESENVNKKTRLEVGIMDATQPEVYLINKTQNAADGTVTVIFNVTDRNYEPSDLVTTEEITTWIDGIETDSIVETLTYKEIQASVDNTTKVLGHQYTLVLSEIVETHAEYVATGRVFKELSGTLEIKIAANAAKDIKENTLNTDTTTITEFVDFIRPEISYKYTVSSQATPGDINYQGKTFTMVFDITDKYYKENTLDINDLTILIGGETIDWTKVDKDLTITDIKATFSKTVDGAFVTDEYVVGQRFTLVLSNLEQLDILAGKQYADYSGVITVAIPAETNAKLIDETGNSNIATTITSGIDIKADVQESGDGTVVDVVDSIWKKVSSSAYAFNPDDPTTSIATITVRGTDKYYASSSLTDKLKVYAHTGSTPGTEVTDITDDVEIDISDATPVYKDGTTDEQIGDEYTITITGFAQDVNQIKIEILEEAMLDQSGNGNKATEMILYNTLELTTSEYNETSGFLGNTTIQRQNIENVTFLSDTSTVPETGWWDASAAGDNSIKAWATQTAEQQTNGVYTVYIASDDEIFANQNSAYLFAHIAAASYEDVEVISNLNLLNTSSVTNMAYMFRKTGAGNMSTLNLGNNFDTSNVITMDSMFRGCGIGVMTSLSLGDKFDTSKVTYMGSMFEYLGNSELELDLGDKFNTANVKDMRSMFRGADIKSLDLGENFDTSSVTNMSNMFREFGYSEMTSLDLGDKFDTSIVTDMGDMFADCGYTKMQTLDLGDLFDTTSVTNMAYMFYQCGATALTGLDLGDNFNTSAVQNMSGMFYGFATESSAMTSLDLREKFYTTAVTDMSDMFNGCGAAGMTSLDLGPAFTKIPETNTGFVTNTGKSGAIIYAPEAIYNDMTHFRLNTDSSTTIQYTIGTINAKYKPEWSKISSSITIDEDNLANSTMTIKIKGNVDSTVYENAIQTITSAVVAGNDTNSQINVLVDGELAEDITQTIVADSVTANEVQYTITLSNFEKEIRKGDKNFREWAGNVALQFARGSLVDAYGNKNMVQIDVDPDGDGTTEIQQIQLKDETALSANDTTNNDKMFADFIRPEFTYEYYNAEAEGDTNANTIIDYVNNKVTIVFDVTDKYFASTTLATDTTGSNITVKVDEDADANTAITKALSKKTLEADQVVGNITYKANGDIYYTVNGTSKKVGERYELVITGLESTNGIGYSGPMTLAFPEGTITDESGNTSIPTTITIGIDQPTNHPEHSGSQIVDVVNPVWSYADSEIDRTNDEVNIYLIGSDKYYKEDTLDTGDITVYVDNSSTMVDTDRDGETDTSVSRITKNLTDITSELDETRLAELIEGAGLTSLMTDDNKQTAVGVVYKLTLGNFGTISGQTKFDIAANTIEDTSGNKNILTTINVGNVTWVEDNEPLEEGATGYPRYPAFREHIVDFRDPTINYTYSVVEGAENPDIDYEQKTVTVKFTVTDKYLLESDLIKTVTNADGTTTQLPKNMKIIVDGTEVYNGNSETQSTQVTTSIFVADIANGKEYTLVVSNMQQEPNNAFDFSGPMQIAFEAGVIDDTSGNKNAATTISLDTEIGSDIVDVVDPIIYYNGSSINRVNNTVTLYLKAEDKYITSQTLASAEESVKVKVIEADGTITHVDGTISFENGEITHTDKGVVSTSSGKVLVNDTTTISKAIDLYEVQSQSYVFQVTLSGFGIYEGITSIIIPENVILDTSGNGNIETEILVGREADTTAFKDSLVDFTKPTWNYVTSTINRDWDDTTERRLQNGEGADGTVTLEVKGTDTYFDDSYFNDSNKELDLSAVKVYVNDVLNTSITKSFAEGTYKEYINDELDANGRLLEGVKYTIVLGNFQTNEGTVRIEVPADAVKDTSTNGNDLKSIDVGNEAWVEEDEPLESTDANYPKYQAFRTDIVDFVKPIVTYQYASGTNPVIDRTNNQVSISFNVTDTNFLESNIQFNETQKDIQVFVDVDNNEKNVTDKVTGTLTSVDYTNGTQRGKTYTLTLSDFEEDALLASEVFLRHSGVIKLVIAEDTVFDSSGNPNNETTLIIDQGDGDGDLNGTLDVGEDLNGNDQLDTGEDEAGVIVDFIKPKITYNSKYINWEDRYAEVTIRATDRFYDTSTTLLPTDITLYEQNDDGDYVQINDFNGKIEITRTPLYDVDDNLVGYDYKIKLKDFEEEFKLRINIPANKMGDTSGNYNEQTNIDVALDNKRPTWEYVSADTTKFVSDGEITFNVKGVDKFLDLTRSGLTNTDLRVIKDGVDITENVSITVNYDADNSSDTEKSKAYGIVVTGLTQDSLGQSPVGTYSLVFAEGTLYDTFDNVNAATTISFSQAVITSNTGNYVNVTYHVSPDLETVHKSYIHELMSVNTTGTNFENTTYRPSTLGELYNNGENPLFAEPMYEPAYEADGYTVRHDYSPKSFAGWAEADEDGNIIYYTDDTLETVSDTETAYTRVYGLYDEIPSTVTHLKAVWQDAKVIFVKSTGSESNSGTTSTEPVPDLATAFSKLDSSGTSTSNVIVIMDAIEWDDDTTLTGNATITSLYAGTDYGKTQNAELMISSNMIVNGDIIFDNIKLYADSTTVSDGSDYIGNGNYTNMLISNYSGDITLGRGVTTPSDKYTFGAIIGGNYKTEVTGNFGTHTIRVEAGRYNNIIAGSTLAESTTTSKFATHEVVIGNMKDAAISRNSKLTITGYVAMGENEKANYPAGSTVADDAFDKSYANVTLYSGTFTGANAFVKADEEAAIYLRSINGQSDGILNFEMYGGAVTGNVYTGARTESLYPTDNYNTMSFYGGQVTGNIFGQGATDTFRASSTITLQGCFKMTGNVFGGSNATAESTGTGTGNTNITINSSSVTVNGNIYGGSNGVSNSGYITGTTTITLKAGTVGSIYGSGKNSGNSGATTITVENGTVSGNIIGGAYNEQGGITSAITVLGGTVSGNIYGGNENTAQSYLDSDTRAQDITIIIGDTDPTIKPTITGTIYGSGNFDKVDVVDIYLNEAANVTSVFGGASANSITAKANIYLNGMTVNEIYGGGQNAGTVTTANIFLQSGTATNVYGGGYKADVTTANIKLEGTATVGTIYGGPSSSGTVSTANVTLTSGTLTNVFGGGDSANVTDANVELDGITIDTIHGGSRTAGTTTNANVTLTTGKVTTVFGGGFGGETINSDITFAEETDGAVDVTNVYGGNDTEGTTMNAVINIQGATTIKGKLYGGGYKSAIGKENEAGSTTINISGGTINNDINGGSEQSIVYGTTNINIGQDATGYSLTAGNINILGTIYGAGDSTNTDYETVSVQGDTHIKMDNSEESPITFSGSIYGAGKGATYSNTDATDTEDGSTIQLVDLGTATDAHELISIERTGTLYIGNSYIELFGKQDINNASPLTSYTLNRITHALTVYNNTTLYTRRGFNMVGGFNSYRTVNTTTGTGTKATVSITDNVATTNVDNRLYTFEGINLIFAKQEGDIYQYANASDNIWGEVNGMTFFGMYRISRDTNAKEFDLYDANIYDEGFTGEVVEDFFANGTFVEAQHEPSHSTSIDGFYTNVADYTDPDNIAITPQVIDVVDGGNYYDWIIGAEIVTYDEMLIASASGKDSMAEILLDYNYAPNATYTFDNVSLNALNTNIELINSTEIPVISEDANTTFGLTMETGNSGWLKQAETNIYTANYGSFDGDTLYKTGNADDEDNTATVKFTLHNSINISASKDLGNVNLRLIGKTPESADGTRPANTFIVVIALNLQTVVEQLEEQENFASGYVPRFTNSSETELHYTSDSKVDVTYTLYNETTTNPYENGAYRVLTTTTPFPAGTRITLNDKVTGIVYYYHVTGTETEYRLSNFLVMDSTDDYYVDSDTYYNSEDGYVYERYDVSIDFIDSGITGNITQETYLELRSQDGTVKCDNGDAVLKYNLYSGANAVAIITETITNEGQIYSVVEDVEITFTLTASITEQKTADGKTIMDTKFYDKLSGLVIEILDPTGQQRVKSPEVQNFAIVNVDDATESYVADESGEIRIPLMETLSSVSKNYKMTISQNNVDPGKCSVNLYFFASDDGLHLGEEQYAEKEFYAIFVNKSQGLVGIDATEDSRIINKSTGLNLEGNSGIDMTVSIGGATEHTNVRIELYKRNPTYTEGEDETTTYTGTAYTLVDIKDYLDGTWQTPEEVDPPTVDDQGVTTDEGLITDGSYQYILLPRQTYEEGANDTIEIDLARAIKSTVGTGEYKIVVKSYHDNILTQTVRKTFIVTQ